MTAIKFVPISLDTATSAISVLRDLSHTQWDEGGPAGCADTDRIVAAIAKAIEIAGEHVDESEMLCMELLELIGRTTGRQLSTVPGPSSLAEARKALEEMAPVLGNVVSMPRAPERETAKAIDAGTARALADMPGPIAVRVFVERKQRPREPAYDEIDPVDVWAVPREREVWCGHVVRSVEWVSPKAVRLTLGAKPPPGSDAW